MWTPDIFEEQSEEPMELLVAGLLCVETENTDAEISGCPIPGKHSSQPFCITDKKSRRGRAVFLALQPRRLCVTPGLFPAGAAKGTQLPREGGTPRLLHPACPSEGLDWRWLSPWEQSGDTCGRHDGGVPLASSAWGPGRMLHMPRCPGRPPAEEDPAPHPQRRGGRPWVNYLGEN